MSHIPNNGFLSHCMPADYQVRFDDESCSVWSLIPSDILYHCPSTLLGEILQWMLFCQSHLSHGFLYYYACASNCTRWDFVCWSHIPQWLPLSLHLWSQLYQVRFCDGSCYLSHKYGRWLPLLPCLCLSTLWGKNFYQKLFCWPHLCWLPLWLHKCPLISPCEISWLVNTFVYVQVLLG